MKSDPYGIKDFIRNYHYRSYPKLNPGIVSFRITPCGFHACTKKLSLPWNYKIKDECNYPRYGRVYDWKLSLILGYHNNWIIIYFLDDITGSVEYKCMNITIIDGNVMKISLIIHKVNYGAIDIDNTSCQGYYVIIFSSYPYTIQE